MKIGVYIFPTDYSIGIVELARALEERGYASLYVTEHTHIPTCRRSPWPGGAELPREYSHTLDPFVGLAAAAAVTEKLRLGTGIVLLTEHDPIVAAKSVVFSVTPGPSVCGNHRPATCLTVTSTTLATTARVSGQWNSETVGRKLKASTSTGLRNYGLRSTQPDSLMWSTWSIATSSSAPTERERETMKTRASGSDATRGGEFSNSSDAMNRIS